MRRIILTTTIPGDLVIDGFNGTGTTVKEAVKARRRAIGIELSEERARLAAVRVFMETGKIDDIIPQKNQLRQKTDQLLLF